MENDRTHGYMKANLPTSFNFVTLKMLYMRKHTQCVYVYVCMNVLNNMSVVKF